MILGFVAVLGMPHFHTIIRFRNPMTVKPTLFGTLLVQGRRGSKAPPTSYRQPFW